VRQRLDPTAAPAQQQQQEQPQKQPFVEGGSSQQSQGSSNCRGSWHGVSLTCKTHYICVRTDSVRSRTFHADSGASRGALASCCSVRSDSKLLVLVQMHAVCWLLMLQQWCSSGDVWHLINSTLLLLCVARVHVWHTTCIHAFLRCVYNQYCIFVFI
jgi:hypothetical protein